MKTNTLVSFSFIAALASCTPHTPKNPTPERLPETPSKSSPTIPAKPHITRWSFSPRHNTNRYRSTTETVITRLDSSDTRRDSTHTTIEFTLEIDYLATLINLSGQITNVATNRNNAPHLPLKFSGTISSGRFSLDPTLFQAQDELCNTGISQSLGEIRTAVYSLPMELDSRSTWGDSTSTATCSGKALPTVLEIIRSYKVFDESHNNKEPGLLLNREDQIRLSGQGTQEQHQLQLQGTGTAISRVTIDSRTGILTKAETTQQLQLIIGVSGRSEKFTQITHQKVDLLH